MPAPEALTAVHVLRIVELTEGAYGEAAGWLQRIACWALVEQRVDHVTWCRWLNLMLYAGTRGQAAVRKELIGGGHFDAFWLARMSGTS